MMISIVIVEQITHAAVVILTSFGPALGGALLGYLGAIVRLRKERAFDKTLLWYERASESLRQTKANIQDADSMEVTGEPQEARDSGWYRVMQNELSIRLADAEAKMFATAEVVDSMTKLVEVFREVGKHTKDFDIRQLGLKRGIVVKLIPQLDSTLLMLTNDVRSQLGLRKLNRVQGESNVRSRQRMKSESGSSQDVEELDQES